MIVTKNWKIKISFVNPGLATHDFSNNLTIHTSPCSYVQRNNKSSHKCGDRGVIVATLGKYKKYME